MKALKLLGALALNTMIANPMQRLAISGQDIEEAIAELEALQSRSCEGCKNHIVYDMPEGNINSCLIYEIDERLCVRKFKWLDRYEAKEQL